MPAHNDTHDLAPVDGAAPMAEAAAVSSPAAASAVAVAPSSSDSLPDVAALSIDKKAGQEEEKGQASAGVSGAESAQPIVDGASSSSSPAAVAAAAAAAPASSPAVSSTGDLLAGGYKRGGDENDPETGYYDEVDLEDFEFDEGTGESTPCGDKFRISKDDLLDGEDIARCPSCSLLVKVVYDPDDLEED